MCTKRPKWFSNDIGSKKQQQQQQIKIIVRSFGSSKNTKLEDGPYCTNSGTKRLETIVKRNDNVSLNENFTSALSIGLGRICVWLSLTMPKTIKSCNMTWYV